MTEKIRWELPGTMGPPPFYYDKNYQPRRYGQPQLGGNWFSDATDWVSGAADSAGSWISDAATNTAHWVEGAANDTNKFLKNTKIVSKVAGGVAKVAGLLGQPEVAGPAASVAAGAEMLGWGAPQEGGGNGQTVFTLG